MATVALGENRTNDSKSFELAVSLTGPTTSDVYIIPSGMKIGASLALTLKSTLGSAKVQSTISPRKEIVLGSDEVEWADWERGSVDGSVQEWVGPATGLRVIVASGTWKFELAGE